MSRWDSRDPRQGCLGIDMGKENSRSLCARGLMCPRCEERRASARAWNLTKRLQNDLDIAEDSGLDLSVGVLTVTLPGREHPIRNGSLRDQYDYFTARTTVPGLKGIHSMRGLNSKLKDWGFSGGCHNIEFTWNDDDEWWNTHCHSIVIGYDVDIDTPLSSTVNHKEIPGELLLSKKVSNKGSTDLYKLGFGGLYSLDWAEKHEFVQTIKYASKVAYMTKPIKAPRDKRAELRRFFNGADGGKFPRLSRPILDWGRGFVPNQPI